MNECFRSGSRAKIESLRYEQLRGSIEAQKAIKKTTNAKK